MMRKPLLSIVLLLACSDDGPASDPSTTGPSGSSGGEVTTTTSSGADESSSGTTDTGSSSDTGLPPLPVCGDGEVEGDEECDDTNDDPDDGCDNDCNRSGVVEWTVTWNGDDNGDDLGRGVAVAPDGDVWVVGTSPFAGDDVVELRRFDPGAGLEATIAIMSGEDHQVSDLAIGDDGTLYAVGTTRGTGLDEGWVVALDSSGVQQWRYTRASNDDWHTIEATSVAAGAAGVWVCGFDERAADPGDRDAWLVRLDDLGVPVWEEPFSGDADEDALALAVAVAPDGSSLVGGSQVRGSQSVDGWVRRYDADGNAVWTAEEAGSLGFTEERIRGVAFNPDGHAIVAGQVENADDPVVWTAAYDDAGALLWERTWPGPDGLTNGARDVGLTAEGDPVIVGSVGIVGEGTDIFVRRYSADGNFELWTSYFRGDAMFNDEGWRVAVATDGSIYATGETSAQGHGTDGWLRKFEPLRR